MPPQIIQDPNTGQYFMNVNGQLIPVDQFNQGQAQPQQEGGFGLGDAAMLALTLGAVVPGLGALAGSSKVGKVLGNLFKSTDAASSVGKAAGATQKAAKATKATKAAKSASGKASGISSAAAGGMKNGLKADAKVISSMARRNNNNAGATMNEFFQSAYFQGLPDERKRYWFDYIASRGGPSAVAPNLRIGEGAVDAASEVMSSAPYSLSPRAAPSGLLGAPGPSTVYYMPQGSGVQPGFPRQMPQVAGDLAGGVSPASFSPVPTSDLPPF